MANTVQDNNRVAWTYTDNNGEDYRVSAKSVYVNHVTDGAKYGGSLAAASLKPKPKGLRMRGVYATTPSGKTMLITCYEKTATAFTTPGTTLTRSENGVDVTATTTADTLKEKSGKQAKQQA